MAAGFRNRGGDISRVEGFADCASGFAVTLLVGLRARFATGPMDLLS